MPPKSLPPPPRPDPVTLDQIVASLTTPGVPLDEKAYHLVALSTIAFHPSVKLFLFEDPTLPLSCEAAHRARRESILRNTAAFLAQRNNAICEECRWETVSLLGELCRMESTTTTTTSGNSMVLSSAAAPQEAVDARLRDYARSNLEYLALLPWFPLAMDALLSAAGKNGKAAAVTTTTAASATVSSTTPNTTDGGAEESLPKPSREELRNRLREKQFQRGAGGASDEPQDQAEVDEDVVIALRDIKNALPTIEGTGSERRCVWSSEAMAQAHDLMFLDASTSVLHLIPTVSRCCADVCAMCLKRCASGAAAAAADGAAPKRFLRCSNCKAVYYCSAECQRKHWATSHRQPCKTFTERAAHILEQYYKLNAASGKRGKKSGGAGEGDGVTVLEVPLEPSLFFETRRYLFDHRDKSFNHVNFYDYFMKYTVRGS